MAKKPLEIDACAGSQLRDTQGEMLSIEGADISDLQAGKGRWNDNHGKGFFNSIGRITEAKKILKAEDCDNERQKYYWEKVKAPYIYVKGILYDDEDHPNAKAAAAILRNIHKADVPLKLKASVEGGVISRGVSDPTLLARTKIHSIALTFTPANNATLVEPVSLDKSHVDEEADMMLIKSVIHLAETDVPSFRHITRDASAAKVISNIEKIVDLMKSDSTISVPTKQEILQYALEAKIESNISKIYDILDSHKEEKIDKGIKEAAIGAAMLGAVAAPSSVSASKVVPSMTQQKTAQVQDVSRMPASHQEAYKAVAAKNPLLGAIGQVESSGGLKYDHRPISDPKSMHYGHTAGGMFGMMPNAAKFILSKDTKLANKYPELAEAAKDINTNHSKFTQVFNNSPQIATDFAEAHVNRNKAKTKNLEMLIHAHNHGLKGTWDRYKNEGMDGINNADYVKKVMKVYNDLSSKSKPQPLASINKALTAGYGGAGSPGSMTGGSMLQSESVDDGRKGFKYVTCDDCGKEQVYAKFQVKCRDCGKSWSLNKLHKVMCSLKG